MNFFQSLSSKIKYKRIRLTKQGWIYQNPKPLVEISDNPLTFFEQLTEAQRAVLNYLLVWSNSYNSLYFSQSTIAQDLGYSRGFVNRTLAIFEAAGLIASNYRHKTSSLYKVSKWFKDIKVRESLAPFFKAFTWFPLALLTTQITGSVTQEVSNIYINNHVTVPNKNIIDNMSALRQGLAKMLTRVTDSYNPIPQVIRDLPELKLTRWGQIKLCAFPDKAIEHGKKQIKFAEHVTDKFRWFFRVCQEWCDVNQIKPNWHRVQLLEREFDMPNNASMTLDKKMTIPVDKPPRAKQPDLPVIYAKANFERTEKENNYQHKVKVDRDAGRVENMTPAQAETYAAELINAHPTFGGIRAAAFLREYQQMQNAKQLEIAND